MIKVGVAREIITPQVGGYLFGYNNHTQSTSVHDDLTVTALLLQSENTSAMLVSATVCLIHDSLVAQMRNKIQEATGVPAQNIIISATHTHSGPPTTAFSRFDTFGTIDWDYCNNIFIPQTVKAAVAAAASLQPAKMGVGTTHSLAGINRRQLLPDNSVVLGQNPWDHYDPTMTVISFVGDKNRKTIANIIHIGAHCTASGNNTEITRDWAGVMADRLETESGGMSLFVNGTLGDVAPRMANGDSIGDIKHAMEVGGLAGIDAVRAYKTIRTFYDEPLQVVCGGLKLPYNPPIAREDIPIMLEKCGEWDTFQRASLQCLAEMYKSEDMGEDHWEYEQNILRIGPVVLVPYPFEVCSEIGLRLRSYSPYAHTLTLSCTNGSHSYLPAESQICRGGYEIKSFLWFRPRQLPDDADKQLVEQNLELIRRFT